MSPAKHPHTIIPLPPCFTVGTTHVEIIRSPTLRLTKTWRLEPQISNLYSSDQRTAFHQSSVHCLCFLAQASLFFLLVSCSSVFFVAAIWPSKAWFTQAPLNSWCCDVCYLNSVKHLFGLQSEVQSELTISEAGNSNKLILCSRGKSGSSFSVAVLMRASFIIALDGFCDCTWRNFQSSRNVPTWLTFMSLQ